jgi:hypothetical protein
MVAEDSLVMKLVVEGGDTESFEKLQGILEKHGLSIEAKTRSGLILSGAADCFEELFKPRISKKNDEYLFQSKPNFDKLPVNMNYRVYIPRKPTYF